MSSEIKSESSSPDSEIGPCSSKFDPVQALYSEKVVIPVKDAPMYETVRQYEDAQKNQDRIVAVGQAELVRKREQEKEAKRLEEQRIVEEKNRQRFAQYRDLVPQRQPKLRNNVLTRINNCIGPLSALKDCVDHRLRLKVNTITGVVPTRMPGITDLAHIIERSLNGDDSAAKVTTAPDIDMAYILACKCYEIITRNATGIRGELHATLVAFDKQWNLALCDVLEVWRRKAVKKRKVPPCLGTPVAKGTAAKISPVPVVTETPLGGGVWECTRHLPQMMVRGEHVVLVNIVER